MLCSHCFSTEHTIADCPIYNALPFTWRLRYLPDGSKVVTRHQPHKPKPDDPTKAD